MNILITFGITLVLIDLTSIAALYLRALASAPVNVSSFITPAVIILGVLVALITFARNIKHSASEDYLKSALELMEHAFETLNVLDDQGRPQNSPMRWLASARLLRTSQNISRLMVEDSHHAIYRAQREYWRARFHDLIKPYEEGFPEDYYAEDPKHMYFFSDRNRHPLSERSLTVLYRFVRWPKDFQDPVKGDPKFTDDEIEQMRTFGPKNLGEFMAKVRGL